MKVCVVGSGGREHALAYALARTADVVVTPGNAGNPWSTPTPATEIDADLYVIGPEQPLVDGLADELRAKAKLVFGPGAAGAQLEGSKAWMKQIMAEAGVPTARHGAFRDVEPALQFLRTLPGLYVIKTDGLAAGKGVLVTTDVAEAEADVRHKLSGAAFGAAGRTVVIEEGMTGPEVSLLCLTDGHQVMALPAAQDFKRVGDGDTGPNTGGMGAYSPLPFVNDATVQHVLERFVEPTLARLRQQDIDYRGVLYAGIMLTPDGPKLLEYNVRFGDPETQVVLPRLGGDLAETLAQCADGSLHLQLPVAPHAAVTVVCAAEGYPAKPVIGSRIDGMDEARAAPDVSVYCAGVERRDGGLVTSGGRVLSITGTGATIEQARQAAYNAVSKVSWPNMVVRFDIAATQPRR